MTKPEVESSWRDRAKQMEALNQAALALAGDLDVDSILRTARKPAGARHGALGVPDGHGGFAKFITAGISERASAMSPRLISSLGPITRAAAGATMESWKELES